MSELPKSCKVCLRHCGGEYIPAAWAVYEGKNSYWLCEKHYQEAFPPLDKEEEIPYTETINK